MRASFNSLRTWAFSTSIVAILDAPGEAVPVDDSFTAHLTQVTTVPVGIVNCRPTSLGESPRSMTILTASALTPSLYCFFAVMVFFLHSLYCIRPCPQKPV